MIRIAPPDAGRVRRYADLAALVQRERRVVLSVLLRLVQDWLDGGTPAPTRSLDGYGEWSRIAGGIIAHRGGDHLWLDPESRPRPKRLDEWADLYAAWGCDDQTRADTRSWMFPAEVCALIHDLTLVELATTIAANTERGEVTRTGRLLAEMVESGRSAGGHVLRRCKTRNGWAYRPERVETPAAEPSGANVPQ